MTTTSILDSGLQGHSYDHDAEPSKPSAQLFLDPKDYPGGIAFWGALAAVYDTSVFPAEDGVHVHARRKVGGKKEIDQTFEEVVVPLTDQRSFAINGRHGVAYNIATIFRRELSALACPHCQGVHCDEGFWAVHYHCTHHCEHCGGEWQSEMPTVSNPLMLLKQMVGDTQQHRTIIDPVERVFSFSQKDWPGGIQLWGSNPALLWTSSKFEEGGIHVHACREHGRLAKDNTYGIVEIDGIKLAPEHIRHLMAQKALPDLTGLVVTLKCPSCNTAHFDSFDRAVVPHLQHECESCGTSFGSNEAVVSNPVVAQLAQLRQNLSNKTTASQTPSCTQCQKQLSSASS